MHYFNNCLTTKELFEVLVNASFSMTLEQQKELKKTLEERKIMPQEARNAAIALFNCNTDNLEAFLTTSAIYFIIAAELAGIPQQEMRRALEKDCNILLSRDKMQKRVKAIRDIPKFRKRISPAKYTAEEMQLLSAVKTSAQVDELAKRLKRTRRGVGEKVKELARQTRKKTPEAIIPLEPKVSFPRGWSASSLYNPQSQEESKVGSWQKNAFLRPLLITQGFIQLCNEQWFRVQNLQKKESSKPVYPLYYLIFKPILEAQTLEAKNFLYSTIFNFIIKAKKEKCPSICLLVVDPTMIEETKKNSLVSLASPQMSKAVQNAYDFIYASLLGDGNMSRPNNTYHFLFFQAVSLTKPNVNKLGYVIDSLIDIPSELKTPSSLRLAQGKDGNWFAILSFYSWPIFEQIYKDNYLFVEKLSSLRYAELFQLMTKIKITVKSAAPQKLTASLFEESQRRPSKIDAKVLPSSDRLKSSYFKNGNKTLAELYQQDGSLVKGQWSILTVYSKNFNSCCRLALVIYELTNQKVKFFPLIRGLLDSPSNLAGNLEFDLVLCSESHGEFAALIKPHMRDSVMYKLPDVIRPSQNNKTEIKAANYKEAFEVFIQTYKALDSICC